MLNVFVSREANSMSCFSSSVIHLDCPANANANAQCKPENYQYIYTHSYSLSCLLLVKLVSGVDIAIGEALKANNVMANVDFFKLRFFIRPSYVCKSLL